MTAFAWFMGGGALGWLLGRHWDRVAETIDEFVREDMDP